MSFLRTNHPFLSAAIKHPSASFLLFNNLNPLTKTKKELASASFADVQPLVGEDPYEKVEEDLIKEFNSDIFIPQLVFLGLDENKEGITWKDLYKGQPVFALDVTPKGSVKEKAEKLIESMSAKGYAFAQDRFNLSLAAPEGMTC